METTNNYFKSIEEFNVVSDVFSQAITGELIGMSNFASLSGTIEDPHEKMEAVEHADSERQHAEAYLAHAKKMELNININLNGEYWRRVREVFLSYSNKNDFIACLIIQEVMLESFAVSMYTDVGNALKNSAGKLFLSIADEEKDHMEHSIEFLREELKQNEADFLIRFEKIHFDCMTILSEFSAKTDLNGHCGVCNGDCMKNALHHIGLDVVSMRGNALSLYAKTLDSIGIPGEKSIQWIANLPA
ncbi:ferritin-like domain-containing protein [Tamlana haliotis]|uniref:Ferritin-like domain-containing protein n=1 Tax=Pseudotamlana haliotis TaxID=2614804 RepID=A0A6N6MN37_9FLAO|nr:ferritin-like domain-containing protein [Tamlana haliotis]KAB1071351.1 ferritin-like domain-containing protein [Tamlana haliotis]